MTPLLRIWSQLVETFGLAGASALVLYAGLLAVWATALVWLLFRYGIRRIEAWVWRWQFERALGSPRQRHLGELREIQERAYREYRAWKAPTRRAGLQSPDGPDEGPKEAA